MNNFPKPLRLLRISPSQMHRKQLAAPRRPCSNACAVSEEALLPILLQGRAWPYGHGEEPLDADAFLGGSLDGGHGSVPSGRGSPGPATSSTTQQRASMMHRLHQDFQAYQVQARPLAAPPPPPFRLFGLCNEQQRVPHRGASNCFERPISSRTLVG